MQATSAAMHHTTSLSDHPSLGPLDALLDDEDITDIMINRFDRIFVERAGRMLTSDTHFQSEKDVIDVAHKLIKWCGKEEIAAQSAIIEAMIPGGSRLSIIMPPLALEGPSISIRKFPKDTITMDDMVQKQLLSAHVGAFLKACMEQRVNIIISGSTSSGKTTMLNALSAYIPSTQRIITIEDTPELRILQENVVRLETQEFQHSGSRIITARDLVKCSLRMRPDRIIMGEVRGAEAFDLLQAVNTGHDGSMATIHANNPREAFTRLENMVTMADSGLPSKFIRQQVASALDIIIQMQRVDGKRRITHVTEFVGLEGEVVTSQDLFLYKSNPQTGNGDYVWGNFSSRNAKLQKAAQAAAGAK